MLIQMNSSSKASTCKGRRKNFEAIKLKGEEFYT